jgi:nucleoside-diphosphate-sugar epimerase
MKILLTGASGCVGRALLPELVTAGHEIVSISRTGASEPGVETVPLDLAAGFDAARLPANIDAVLHVAQSRRYREFPDGAPEVFQINTAATHKLVDYALRAGAKSFLYASTGSVYLPSHDPSGEDAPTSAAGFYPASKLAAEAILAPYAAKLPVGILRLFYIYGPGQHKMLVDGLADRIRSGTPVTLQGDGGIRIAPTASADVARVFRQAAEQQWAGTWNVASPNVTTLRELANAIGEAVGKPAQFEQVDGQRPPTALPKLDKLSSRFDLGSFMDLKTGLGRMFP